MILGSAERLNALSARRAACVDVFRDGRRPDEADRIDPRMLEDRVDGHAIAVDDVERAGRQSALDEQPRELQRRRGIFLAGFHHERVSAGQRKREHPHRHHRGEIERRNPRAHTQRLTHGLDVDPGRNVCAEVAGQQMRDAACELDDVEPALDLAARIVERFAVFARNRPREAVSVRDQRLAEREQHRSATRWRRRRPAGEGSAGGADRGVHFVRRSERNAGLHFAGRRVVDVAETFRAPRHIGAADEMPQRPDCSLHRREPFRRCPCPQASSSSARRMRSSSSRSPAAFARSPATTSDAAFATKPGFASFFSARSSSVSWRPILR